MGKRTLNRSHAILLAAALVALALYNLVRVMQAPPGFDALWLHDAVLDAPISVERHTGRRSMRSPYAILEVQGKHATIENLCFLWHCELPPALAALRAGDRVRIWIAGDEIWQLEYDGEHLLTYDQALDAHERAATRQGWVYGALALAMVAAIAWLRSRRQGPLAAGGFAATFDTAPFVRRKALVRMPFRIGGNGLHLPSLKLDDRALATAGLERFREAASRHDREAMIAALVAAGVSDAAAQQVVDGLFAKTTGIDS
jgi:hypothetical protein